MNTSASRFPFTIRSVRLSISPKFVGRVAFVAGLVVLSLTAPVAHAENGASMAREAIDEGRFEDAKSAMADRLEADANDAEALFLTGWAEAGLGNFEVGEERIRQAIEVRGDDAEYHARLGSVMIERAQTMNMFTAGPVFMEALDKFKKAVQLDPDNLHAHIGLCRYYWNAPAIGGGSMKLAKEHAAEVERIDPFLGHVEHALIAQKEGRSSDAAQRYAKAAALQPNAAWIHFELGKLHQTAGEVEEARAAYEKTLELDPDHKEAEGALSTL